MARLATTLTGAALALTACTAATEEPPALEHPAWQPLAEVPRQAAAYVDALVTAWRQDSVTQMRRYGDTGVADSLQALEPSPGVGGAECFSHAGVTSCEVVTADLRSLWFSVDLPHVRAGGEHAVTAIKLLGGLPTTDEEYVDALVTAWREGDRLRALRFAVPEAVDTLFAHGTGKGWTRRGLDAALGARFAFYENSDGELLVLKFNIADLSHPDGGTSQAVTEAEFPHPGDGRYNWS